MPLSEHERDEVLAIIRQALDPYYSEIAPGGSEDAAGDILNALDQQGWLHHG